MAKTLLDLIEASRQAQQNQPTAAEIIKDRTGTFSRAVGSGINTAKAEYNAAINDFATADQARKDTQGLGPDVTSLDQIKNAGDFGQYVTGLAGQTLGAGLPAIGTAAGAALAAPVVGTGAAVAGALGSAAASLPQFFGSNLLAQKDAGVKEQDLNRLRAFGTAVGQTALDTVPAFHGIARLEKAAKSTAKATRTLGQASKEIAKATGKQGVEEAIPEALQGLLQNIQTQGLEGAKDLSSKEVVDQMLNDAIGGFILGGGLGGAGGALKVGKEAFNASKTNSKSGTGTGNTGSPTNQGAGGNNNQAPNGGSADATRAGGDVQSTVQGNEARQNAPAPIVPELSAARGELVNKKDGTIHVIPEADRPVLDSIQNQQYETVASVGQAVPGTVDAAIQDVAKSEGINVAPLDSSTVNQGGIALLTIPEAHQSSPDFPSFVVEAATPLAEAGSVIQIPEPQLETQAGQQTADILENVFGYTRDPQTNSFVPAVDIVAEVAKQKAKQAAPANNKQAAPVNQAQAAPVNQAQAAPVNQQAQTPAAVNTAPNKPAPSTGTVATQGVAQTKAAVKNQQPQQPTTKQEAAQPAPKTPAEVATATKEVVSTLPRPAAAKVSRLSPKDKAILVAEPKSAKRVAKKMADVQKIPKDRKNIEPEIQDEIIRGFSEGARKAAENNKKDPLAPRSSEEVVQELAQLSVQEVSDILRMPRDLQKAHLNSKTDNVSALVEAAIKKGDLSSDIVNPRSKRANQQPTKSTAQQTNQTNQTNRPNQANQSAQDAIQAANEASRQSRQANQNPAPPRRKSRERRKLSEAAIRALKTTASVDKSLTLEPIDNGGAVETVLRPSRSLNNKLPENNLDLVSDTGVIRPTVNSALDNRSKPAKVLDEAISLLTPEEQAQIPDLARWYGSLNTAAKANLLNLFGIPRAEKLSIHTGDEISSLQQGFLNAMQELAGKSLLEDTKLETLDFDFTDMFSNEQLVAMENATDIEAALDAAAYPPLKTSEYALATALYSKLLNSKAKDAKALLSVPNNRILARRLRKEIERGDLAPELAMSLIAADPDAVITPKSPFIGILRSILNRAFDAKRDLLSKPLTKGEHKKALADVVRLTSTGASIDKVIGRWGIERKARVLKAFKDLANPESAFARYADKNGGVSIEDVESITSNRIWTEPVDPNTNPDVKVRKTIEAGMEVLDSPEDFAAWEEAVFGPDLSLDDFSKGQDQDLSRFERLLGEVEATSNADFKAKVLARVRDELVLEGAVSEEPVFGSIYVEGLGHIIPKSLYRLSKTRDVAPGMGVALDQAAKNLSLVQTLIEQFNSPVNIQQVLERNASTILAYSKDGNPVFASLLLYGEGSRQHIASLANYHNAPFNRDKKVDLLTRPEINAINTQTNKDLQLEKTKKGYEFGGKLLNRGDVARILRNFLNDKRKLKLTTNHSSAETFSSWALAKYKAQRTWARSNKDKLKADIEQQLKDWKELGKGRPLHPLEVKYGKLDAKPGKSFEQQLDPLWKQARASLYPAELTQLKQDIEAYYNSEEFINSDPVVQSMPTKMHRQYIQYRELSSFYKRQDLEIQRMEMERPSYIDGEFFGLDAAFKGSARAEQFGVAAENAELTKSIEADVAFSDASRDIKINTKEEFTSRSFDSAIGKAVQDIIAQANAASEVINKAKYDKLEKGLGRVPLTKAFGKEKATLANLVKKVEESFLPPSEAAVELLGSNDARLYHAAKFLTLKHKPVDKKKLSAAHQIRGMYEKGMTLPDQMLSDMLGVDAFSLKGEKVIHVVSDNRDPRAFAKELEDSGAEQITIARSDVNFVSKFKDALISFGQGTQVVTDGKGAADGVRKVFQESESSSIAAELKDAALKDKKAVTAEHRGEDVDANRSVVTPAQFSAWLANTPTVEVQNRINLIYSEVAEVLNQVLGPNHKVSILVPEIISTAGGYVNEITHPVSGTVSGAISSEYHDNGQIGFVFKVNPTVLLNEAKERKSLFAHETGHSVVLTSLLDKADGAQAAMNALFVKYLMFLKAGASSATLPRPFAFGRGEKPGEFFPIDVEAMDPNTLEPSQLAVEHVVSKNHRFNPEKIAAHAKYMSSFHEWAADTLSQDIIGVTKDPALQAILGYVTGRQGDVAHIATPTRGMQFDMMMEDINYEHSTLEEDVKADPKDVAKEWWTRQIAHGNISGADFIRGMAKNFNHLFDKAARDKLTTVAWKRTNKRALLNFIKSSYDGEVASGLREQVLSSPETAAAVYLQAVSLGAIEAPPINKNFVAEVTTKMLEKLGRATSDVALNDLISRFNASLESKLPVNAYTLNTKLRDDTISRISDKVAKLYTIADNKIGGLVKGVTSDLRDMKNPHINKIADWFKPEEGSNATGFFSEQRRHLGQFMNMIGPAFEALSKDDLLKVHQAMQLAQGGNKLPKLTSNQRAAVGAIRRMLRAARNYAEKAGVEIGDLGKNYYPIVLEPEWFMKNSAESVQRLVTTYPEDLLGISSKIFKPKELKGLTNDEIIERTASKLINGIIEAGGLMDDSEVVNRGANYVPGFRFSNTRMLNFIFKDIETAQWFQQGFSQDVNHTLLSYLKGATKRAEITRRLGKENATLNKVLDDAQRYDPNMDVDRVLANLDALMGIHGLRTNEKLHNLIGKSAPEGEVINPGISKVINALRAITYTQILALAPIVAMTDAMGILVRSGDLNVTAKAIFSGVKSVTKKGRINNRGEELAQQLGTATNTVVAEMLESRYDTSFTGGVFDKFEKAFFKYTGMQLVTRATKVAATAASEQFIIGLETMADSNTPRYLEELGITGQDIRRLLSENGRKLKIMSQTERDAATEAERGLDDRMRSALVKVVDSMVLTPDASTQPRWFADPHFQLMKMLKTFTYAFYYNVLYRVMHEAKQGNMTPVIMTASYIPAMIMATALQDLAKGYDDPEWRVAKDGLLGYTVDMANKSGLFGPLGFVNDLAISYQYGGGLGVAGGILGPWTNVVRNGYNFATGEGEESTKAGLSLLPFGNVIKPWWVYD